MICMFSFFQLSLTRLNRLLSLSRLRRAKLERGANFLFAIFESCRFKSHSGVGIGSDGLYSVRPILQLGTCFRGWFKSPTKQRLKSIAPRPDEFFNHHDLFNGIDKWRSHRNPRHHVGYDAARMNFADVHFGVTGKIGGDLLYVAFVFVASA